MGVLFYETQVKNTLVGKLKLCIRILIGLVILK